MNMILCIKQVPESYTVRLDPVTNTLQRDKAPAILNPFDLFAAEEAVRLKERYGGSIHAFTMGIPAASKALKEAMAMGADDGFLLSDRQFAGADTLATAYTLAQGAYKSAAVLILSFAAGWPPTATRPRFLPYWQNFSVYHVLQTYVDHFC